MRILKKIALVIFITISIAVILTIAFISPITKYLVEKYDEKYTGREITMNWAYVNPFTGYIHLSNLKIYELKSKQIFFSVQGVNANFSVMKLFQKNYEISELELNQPKGMIIQIGDKHELNFSDLIEKFSPKKTTKVKAPVKFSILSIKINDGEFYYQENIIPINYFIKKVNIESTGLHWDADTIVAKFSFLSGIGSGDMKGNFTINTKKLDYRLAVIVNKFDLNIIQQYLKELVNYGNFSAYLDADFHTKGSFVERGAITNSGMIAISDFHFGKNKKEDYASFEKLLITIKEVSPKKLIYSFDSIALTRPYVKYERYDHLDNVQTMFGKQGANVKAAKANSKEFNLIIEIANYIKKLSKNFFKSHYKINRLAIYNGQMKFNDYSTSEKFSAELNPIYFSADSIDRKYNKVDVHFNSSIQPYGNIAVGLNVNPKDSSDFDLRYHIQKVPVALFNPYLISYTSFPVDRGTIELKGLWNVRNGVIRSDNHVVIIDPRVSSRSSNKGTKWLPMRFILFFVRERGNVIDYDVPITGNLKNPKFHLKDAVLDAIENIFIKPATTAYRIEVKNSETEIEKSLELNWEMRKSSLHKDQIHFLEKMAAFLEKTPNASISIYPQQFVSKEKEYILLFEAKKKYFLFLHKKSSHLLTESDSLTIDKMSIKDSLFTSYINKQTNTNLLFTMQDKCISFIDSNLINKKFNSLKNNRKKVFTSYFKEKSVAGQIKIHAGNKVIPYNGFSFYKIKYHGEFPESLLRAYRKMNELNNETPRNKFKKLRKQSKSS